MLIKRTKFRFLVLSILVSTLTLSGCVQWNNGFAALSDSTNITLTNEYGEGGTILPDKLRYLVHEGSTTIEDLISKFGEPQNIENLEWGRVVTYRHWSNQIAKNRLEEKWVFYFNEDGFLDHFAHTRNGNASGYDHDRMHSDKEVECNSIYILCKSYKPSSS